MDDKFLIDMTNGYSSRNLHHNSTFMHKVFLCKKFLISFRVIFSLSPPNRVWHWWTQSFIPVDILVHLAV